MKASPADQRLLLDLQAIDTHVRQLDYAVAHLPESETITALQNELSESSAEFITRQGHVEDARIEIERIESDVAVVKQRMAADTAREAQSSNVKDVQALEAEIASLTTRLGNLEEMELEVMQRLEDAEKNLAELQVGRGELQRQISEAEVAREERARGIAAERAALLDQRAVIVSRVPSDLLALYEKQRDRYGIGAALLTRGISGGSGMALSESDLAKIRAASDDEVILCNDSNCILVRTEESGL